MELWWWVWILLTNASFSSASTPYKKERVKALYPGDFIIGALFSLHHQPSTALQQGCGEIWELYGIQRTEVTFKTLDEINADPELLPNITLGADIRDSCWYAPVALLQTIELVREYMSTEYDPQPYKNSHADEAGDMGRRKKPHLIGILGPGASSVSMQVQNLAQLFSLPQVAFSATSYDLSDKKRFSTFFRMVPSDYHQAHALFDLVRYHNWTYISTINTVGNYGESGMTSFRKRAAQSGVCIAHETQILSTAADKEFDSLIERIRPGRAQDRGGELSAHAVVCFCEGKTVRNLLAAIKRKNMTGELLLIGSDGWADRGDIVHGYEEEAHGSLTLRIHSHHINSFDRYYRRLNPYTNKRNPWFREMWEYKYKCSMSNDKKTHLKTCTGLEHPEKYTQDPKMSFVVTGIYAMAHALHDMQRALCGDSPGICASMQDFNITLFMSFLKNVSFTTTTLCSLTKTDEQVQFDENLDPPESNSVYDVLNYQRVGSGWDYEQVGTWIGGTLTFNGVASYSGAGHITIDPSRVESVCSKPCPRGSVKLQLGKSEKRCCWKCTVCENNSVKYNETSCQKCTKGSYANYNKTDCIESPIEHIKYDDTISIIAISFACIGLLSATFTGAVFLKYNETPVVKSSTRELSYLILFGIVVSHASVFAILAKPSIVTCSLSRILPGLSLAIIYASVFTKTNRIARILVGSQKRFPTRELRFMSAPAQVVMSLGLTLAAGCVCAYYLWDAPPDIAMQHPGDVRNVLVCVTPASAVLIPLAPALAFLSACAVLAVRTRALPQNFNEAKFIGAAVYTTCVIWIAFFPTYFGSDSKPITLCMCVTLSATVMLAAMFFPRLYIMLFHPERNNRAHFITSSSIRCHIGRAFGGGHSSHSDCYRDEILIMENCRRAKLRTVSCQTSIERLPRFSESLDDNISPQHIPSDCAEFDPKPFLEQSKCDDDNTNKDGSSLVGSNPISQSLDVQNHTSIREETVSECSLTDEDSMTQIKVITITLGLSNSIKDSSVDADNAA